MRLHRMHDSTRATVGITIVAAVAGASIWLVMRSHREPMPMPAPRPMIAPTPPTPVAPAPIAPAPEVVPPREPELPTVTAGDVGLEWMPAGYVRDIPAAKTAELVTYVAAWIQTDGGMWPRIEYRRGVIFAESEEDRGDDGPFPRSVQPEALHVCGTQAVWMRQALRGELKISEVVCEKNVCAFGGMEYSPRNYLVFHESAGEWTLEAWASVYYATLADQIRAKNYANVSSTLARLHGATCPGEPLGSY